MNNHHIAKLVLFGFLICCTPRAQENVSYADYDLPLALFYNPSLIVKQQDNLVGLGFNAPFSALTDSFSLGAAFSKTIDNRGFALGYERGPGAYPNFISAAFSHAVRSLSWGLAAHIGLDGTSAILAADLAATYYYTSHTLAGLILTNAAASDTAVFKPHLTATFAGAVPLIDRLVYQFDVGARLADYSTAPDNFSVEMQVHKTWLKNPSITLGASLGMQTQADNTYAMHEAGSALCAFMHGGARFSFEAGVASQAGAGRIFTTLTWAPSADNDTTPPAISLRAITDSAAQGPGVASGQIILALTCKDNRGGGIDHWQVLIAPFPNVNNTDQVLRSFSGGSLPPSTIVWDGRDKRGQLCAPGTYYTSLIAFDTHGNRAQTAWITITVP